MAEQADLIAQSHEMILGGYKRHMLSELDKLVDCKDPAMFAVNLRNFLALKNSYDMLCQKTNTAKEYLEDMQAQSDEVNERIMSKAKAAEEEEGMTSDQEEEENNRLWKKIESEQGHCTAFEYRAAFYAPNSNRDFYKHQLDDVLRKQLEQDNGRAVSSWLLPVDDE